MRVDAPMWSYYVLGIVLGTIAIVKFMLTEPWFQRNRRRDGGAAATR